MTVRFLHFADCHLGYWQYNHRDRYNDFGRAFIDVIEIAQREKVDFVLLAGDLFHKRSIEALTLNQAMIGLERLKAAGIPCIAVEGNHELAYQNERLGWVEMLAMRQLLVLLNPAFDQGKVLLHPYSSRKGAYYDPVPGVRIYGLRYYGSSSATALASYAEALAALPEDNTTYTIFVTHAGVEGVLPEQMGGLSHRQLAVLRPYVDYLALGHIHKPFEFDGWIYNPGSTENCSISESLWKERGYYLVEIDTTEPRASNSSRHTAVLKTNPRRPFFRRSVKTDLLNTPEALMAYCRELLERSARDWHLNQLASDRRPVVELLLHGVLPFDNGALDLHAVEELIVEICNPLLPMVKNHTQRDARGVDVGETMSRPELERLVLDTLLQRDGRFRQQSTRWAEVALTLKTMALGDAGPEAIVDELGSQIRQINDIEHTA
jgi:DNA repair exonuclease SbcCD nuclease subunit